MIKYLAKLINNGADKVEEAKVEETEQTLEEARKENQEANDKLEQSIETRQESMECLTKMINLKIQQINGDDEIDDETKIFEIEKLMEGLD